jgi:hypothetical protein
MERTPLDHLLSFASRRYQQRTSEAGTGQRAQARNYATGITGLPSASSLATCDLVSQLFLAIHADHRITSFQERLGDVMDVAELSVPVGMLVPSIVLVLACKL